MTRYILDLGNLNINQTNTTSTQYSTTISNSSYPDNVYIRFAGDFSSYAKIDIELYHSTFGISSSTIGLSSLSGFTLRFRGACSNFDAGHETLDISIYSGTDFSINYASFENTNNQIVFSDDIYAFFNSSQIQKIIANQSLKIELRLDGNGTIGHGDYGYIERYIDFYDEMINVFESDNITVSSLSLNSNVFNKLLIGQIEMFYINTSSPPDGYLWCDGDQISTNTSEEYRVLIDLLNNNGVVRTTGLQTAYLPNLQDKYLYGQASSSLSSFVNSANVNDLGNNSLDINYFPAHSHNINSASFTTLNTNTNTIDRTYNSNIKYPNQLAAGTSGQNVGDGGAEYRDRANKAHTHGVNRESSNANNTTNVTGTINSSTANMNDNAITITHNTTSNSSVSVYPDSIGLRFAIRYK